MNIISSKIGHAKRHNDAGPRSAARKRVKRWSRPGKVTQQAQEWTPKVRRVFIAAHRHVPRGATGPKASPLDAMPFPGSLCS